MEEKWMKMAIELAKKGRGYTSPNPLVGALIIKDDQIIGQGYHEVYGGPHAEINAIKEAGNCKGASIYVTLEPCYHYGKTPPCVEAILKAGFSKVVIGMEDPNPLVAGKSIRKLKEQGLEVQSGILREECMALNPSFIKFIKEKRPYVVMKTAMTLDGKIATSTGESRWITGAEARKYVHELRHDLQAIMVGINTVIKDDPMLTARRQEDSQQPIRLILDSKGRIPLDSKLVQTALTYPTILLTTSLLGKEKEKALLEKGLQIELVASKDGQVDLEDMMKRLGELSIASVLLEGGSTLNDSMIRGGHVDEVISFIAPKMIGGQEAKTPVGGQGVKSLQEAHQINILEVKEIGQDILIRGKVKKACLQD